MKHINEMSALAEYSKMTAERTTYHNRAKEASRLTLPQLYPEMEDTSSVTYATPYQSLGARGVNNLANKMILSLFPPATAFFKLGVNTITAKANNVSEGDMQEAMYKVEKGIINEMETSQLRSVLVDILKQGIIGGSAVLYVPPEGKPKAYNLTSFGIKRDKGGVVIKLIVKESISFLNLPQDVKDELEKGELTDEERKGTKDLDLYNMVILNDKKKYDYVQEIKGVKVKGTEATYTKDNMPYVFIPFVDRGEDYGRSYVEDFIGDLQSYEGLRQSILEAASESARILYLIKPNAILTPKKLAAAKSGDAIQGNPDDVSTLQADKRLDLQIAQQEAQDIKTDLSTIFLLDSAVRRNAERVTAEEIRKVSQELEVALGGIYSTLANVLQEPLVRLYLKRLVKKGILADVLKKELQLEITTGSAALGRGTEFRALSSFLETAIQLLQDQASKFINIPEALQRMAYSLDVNTGDLIKSKDQIAAEEEQAQQAQLEQQAAAPLVNAASQQALAKEPK